MSKMLPLFPVLTEERRNRIRYTPIGNYDFYYTNNENVFILNSEEAPEGSGTYKIIDDEGVWDPDSHTIGIRRKGLISNPAILFGENGIVCSNAIIGVGVIWTSADSKQRGAIEVGAFTKGDSSVEFELDYEFKKAQLRGKIDFTTILYIKKAGTPYVNERHLANTYGCLLGELERITVMLDGNGSEFPIYEVAEPGKPLWYVRCSWEDPTYDQFSDCVAITINTAHHNYKYLDKKKRTYDEQLVIEIMASALSIIISKLKEDSNYWIETTNGQNLQRGSVSEAVYYFLNSFGWDVTSPESLAISIHKFFDKKVTYAN